MEVKRLKMLFLSFYAFFQKIYINFLFFSENIAFCFCLIFFVSSVFACFVREELFLHFFFTLLFLFLTSNVLFSSSENGNLPGHWGGLGAR